VDTFLTVVARFGVAAVFGAAIGFDRELRAKPAGLRTNMVVAVATAGFAYVGAHVFAEGDPSRVAAQVASGIGFLGGGAIFAAGGKPHGITTAAALWAAAAVGIAAGLGAFAVGLAITVVVIVVLWPVDRLATAWLWPRTRHSVEIQAIFPDVTMLSDVRAILTEVGVRVIELELCELGDHILLDAAVIGRPSELAEVEERFARHSGVTLTLPPPQAD
jgi:putative Mg2+ transporter-C (MgtC) family protein